MTYISCRWANEEKAGVLLSPIEGPDLYVDSGELYKDAISGKYGKILDQKVIHSFPTEETVRFERNKLLSSSDWTQLPDAPVDKTAWATYRQALRDITSQEGFPENVVWPVKPE